MKLDNKDYVQVKEVLNNFSIEDKNKVPTCDRRNRSAVSLFPIGPHPIFRELCLLVSVPYYNSIIFTKTMCKGMVDSTNIKLFLSPSIKTR